MRGYWVGAMVGSCWLGVRCEARRTDFAAGELVMDYYDVAEVAGEIKLSYCMFDDNFCGCDWHLSPGDGLEMQ
eukprot:2309559-Pyramimonas_sp.AAC.2